MTEDQTRPPADAPEAVQAQADPNAPADSADPHLSDLTEDEQAAVVGEDDGTENPYTGDTVVQEDGS